MEAVDKKIAIKSIQRVFDFLSGHPEMKDRVVRLLPPVSDNPDFLLKIYGVHATFTDTDIYRLEVISGELYKFVLDSASNKKNNQLKGGCRSR